MGVVNTGTLDHLSTLEDVQRGVTGVSQTPTNQGARMRPRLTDGVIAEAMVVDTIRLTTRGNFVSEPPTRTLIFPAVTSDAKRNEP